MSNIISNNPKPQSPSRSVDPAVKNTVYQWIARFGQASNTWYRTYMGGICCSSDSPFYCMCTNVILTIKVHVPLLLDQFSFPISTPSQHSPPIESASRTKFLFQLSPFKVHLSRSFPRSRALSTFPDSRAINFDPNFVPKPDSKDLSDLEPSEFSL